MKENIFLPLSIVVAGLLIAGGFYFGDLNESKNPPQDSKNNTESSKDLLSLMRPIDSNDNILGDPDSRIVIVEYSDPECPFCKIFHSTMNQIMEEYGSSGKVAWVYRHYPIVELHPNSFKKSEAMECVKNISGDVKFWQFTDKLYESNTEEKALANENLPLLAKSVGVSESKFNACIESGEFAPKVQKDIDNAKEMDILGTPYSILIDRKTGDYYPIEGAYPYFQIKSAIDIILSS